MPAKVPRRGGHQTPPVTDGDDRVRLSKPWKGLSSPRLLSRTSSNSSVTETRSSCGRLHDYGGDWALFVTGSNRAELFLAEGFGLACRPPPRRLARSPAEGKPRYVRTETDVFGALAQTLLSALELWNLPRPARCVPAHPLRAGSAGRRKAESAAEARDSARPVGLAVGPYHKFRIWASHLTHSAQLSQKIRLPRASV